MPAKKARHTSKLGSTTFEIAAKTAQAIAMYAGVKSFDDLASSMLKNPRKTIERMARRPPFDSLGTDAPGAVARAFGFADINDVDVKFDEFKRTMKRERRRVISETQKAFS